MDDHAKRMLAEGKSRIRDGEILGQTLKTTTDSGIILQILGFEILLKCALHVSGKKPKFTHNYWKLWSDLPPDARKAILDKAETRMPGHADLSDPQRLLEAYQLVFEKARYYYEMLEGYTLDESRDLGHLWESLGSPIDEAMVQYYPSELTSLIYGVEHYIENAP